MHDERPRARGVFTRLGVFLFSGLVIGAAIGGFGFHSPAPGALIGAGAGAVLALLLDYLSARKG
ncbi:MAG: hypothetical protein Tsb008_23270 [Rhodothalassiaceae bacterium]